MLASLLFHTRVPHKILLHSKIGFHHLIFNAFAHSSVCVKLLLHISKHVWQLIKNWAAFLLCDTSYVELGFTYSHQGWGLMQKKGGGLKLFGGPQKTFLLVFHFHQPPPSQVFVNGPLPHMDILWMRKQVYCSNFYPRDHLNTECIKFSLSFHLVFIVSPWGAFMLWGTRTFSPMPPAIPQGKKDWTEIRYTVNLMQQY